MRKSTKTIFISVLLSLLTLNITVLSQVRPYRASDRDVQSVIDRLDSDIASIRSELDRAGTRVYDNRSTTGVSLRSSLSELRAANDRLRTNFSLRRSTTANVQDVLDRAAVVDQLITTGSVTRTATEAWTGLRNDVNTLAGYYSLSARWTNNGIALNEDSNVGYGGRKYTATQSQMRILINRLRTETTSFRNSYNRSSGRFGNTPSAEVTQAVADLYTRVQDLNRSYYRNDPYDVYALLRSAATINRYMDTGSLNRMITSSWRAVRDDLSTLAGYYGINSWDWNNPNFGDRAGYPGNRGGGRFGMDARITGTWKLNSSMSDNVSDMVGRTIRTANYPGDQQDRVERVLTRRLTAPDVIVIEKHGNDITMSSPNAQRVTLTANGAVQTETSPNGRTVRTSVTSDTSGFAINYDGDRMNDFNASFQLIGSNQLRVTRRVYLENQEKTVTATSVYDKSSDDPNWDMSGYVAATPPVDNTPYNRTATGWIVPNNTALSATLDTPLSTRSARDGDQFTMTVNSPSQFAGAKIRGHVIGQNSGVFSGRANLSLNFDTIEMSNGRTYNFAGIVNQAVSSNGATITVNNEGNVQDRSQTTRTVTRTGIGAALGALIGAIAGGGQGAAVGAAIGAGAGAGSVVLQGRDSLDLPAGSTFAITGTAPNGTAVYRP